MKQFLLLLSFCVAIMAEAQVPFSQSLEKGTVRDTAEYKVTYRLQYKNHPKDKDYLEDTRIVQIGHSVVKDYSDILFHFDSLRTAEELRGGTTYSNPSGNPYPFEIMYKSRVRNADIKYRLPLGTGTLHYQDSVPDLTWHLISEECDTIIGYECQKASTDFAGRTYTAWFTSELPLSYGPYKFGGLPGLILKIEDSERQFVWEAMGFERSDSPIMMYHYENEKQCSASDAAKTIERYFKSPYTFLSAGMGGARIMIKGRDGKFRNSKEVEENSIPYKSLEIK